MRYILLPVKDLTRAKQRLANIYTQGERTELAQFMLEHTFATVASVKNAAVKSIDGVAVVTLYQPAIDLAERHGFEVIFEPEQISESHSVDFGSRELAAQGVESVLRLPLDLPLLQPADIETILSHDMHPSPSCVIVPSREGTGTNAILRRPPALFPSHFGPNSLAKHLTEAQNIKAQCTVIELPRIALDIDDESDLKALLATENNSLVRQWLSEHDIHRRLTDSGT